MGKLFFPKLALTNLKKNYRTTLPFIITCLLTVMMFYTISALANNTTLIDMGGGENMMEMLSVGTWVIGIFAVIFLFYTNSFLMKRRKREFGLFHILGLERKHIAILLTLETTFTFGLSLLLGLAIGLLFNKLLFLLLLKLIHYDLKLGFQVSWQSMGLTLAVFLGVFVLTLLYNLITIMRSKPIELLHSESMGEREPKTKILLTILGFITLGAGYAISLGVKRPLDALYLFLLAVILVIIGTYLLFTAGSIFILKRLRSNKGYYYKTNHFISVSGMMHRMKQNAAGLATICILSTMVLVVVSTTVSLYFGIDDIIPYIFPYDMTVSQAEAQPREDRTTLNDTILKVVEVHHLDAQEVHAHDDIVFGTEHEGNDFVAHAGNTGYVTTDDIAFVQVITAADYNGLTGKDLHLLPGQTVVYGTRNVPTGDITLLGLPLKIVGQLDSFPLKEAEYDDTFGLECQCFVVADNPVLTEIYTRQADLYKEVASPLRYSFSFNLTGSDAEKMACADTLHQVLNGEAMGNTTIISSGGGGTTIDPTFRIDNRQSEVTGFYNVYGGLFFLGIFLGLTFLMATVVIIYYKQVSEGYDDRRRFVIMQNVGMSHTEVKKAIHSQVLTVFFLPLVMAAIHIAFAFPVITKLLSLFNLQNPQLFTLCTVLTIVVFGLLYGVVYLVTARTYYKIVSA